MNFKKTLLLCLASLLFSGFIYATEEGIASQEAINYYNEGVIAQKKGDFETALKNYQMTSILSSKYNKFIIHNKGVMYVQQGDLTTAEQAFREVLRMDPTYMPAKLNLGLIYDKKSDRLKSLEYWAEVFNIENLKPKNFVLEDQQKVPKEE